MVKVNKKSDTTKSAKKKMSELVERRRSASCMTAHSHTHNLKRSKSVRESLRIIGTKFLHHQRHEVTKSPSLSDIHEMRDHDDHNFNKFQVQDYYQHEVETILKTPMESNTNSNKHKSAKHHLSSYLHFKKPGDLLSHKKHHETPLILTEMPEIVAPKAAALLEIPLKENCQPVNLRHPHCQKFHHVHLNPAIEEEDEVFLEEKTQNFNRNYFRLSINSRRRNTMWSSFSSTSSMLITQQIHDFYLYSFLVFCVISVNIFYLPCSSLKNNRINITIIISLKSLKINNKIYIK